MEHFLTENRRIPPTPSSSIGESGEKLGMYSNVLVPPIHGFLEKIINII